jgi:3-hydroxybutyryl-CoA dehydrogenase
MKTRLREHLGKRPVAVIGAGNIGTGVCADLLLHDLRVVLIDVSAEQLEAAGFEINKIVRFAPLLDRRLPRREPARLLASLQRSTDLRDAANCEFVIENVPEKWETKRRVYAELDAVCQDDVFFGVNTSCIPIGRIACTTTRPQNIVGVHFMNPPYLTAAVEVICSEYTSAECLDYLSGFAGRIKKEMIQVGDYPGFVSNRISHVFMNEAAFVVFEQRTSATVVDRLFQRCFGHKMGPLATADLIGLDTVVNSLDVLYEHYRQSKYQCCPILREMVAAGKLGRKSGQGFYEYPDRCAMAVKEL